MTQPDVVGGGPYSSLLDPVLDPLGVDRPASGKADPFPHSWKNPPHLRIPILVHHVSRCDAASQDVSGYTRMYLSSDPFALVISFRDNNG